MAILIPSKNIYDKQNPKVRDNVIERIEVGAVEVFPNNEYNQPIFNNKFANLENSLIDKNIDNKEIDAGTYAIDQSGANARYYSVSYVAFNNQKSLMANLKIPVIENNKWIYDIFTQVNEEQKENIRYLVRGITKKGNAFANWNYTASGNNITVTESSINYSTPTFESDITNIEFEKEISISETSYSPTVASKATQTLKEWGNVKTATIKKETIAEKEYYTLSLEIMASVRTVAMKYGKQWNSTSGATYPTTIDLVGEYVLYEPKEIEITLYGNTIGIDLTDNTVYINEETAKKVHSVDGNELMQTTNYYVIYENPIEVDVGGELGSSADTAYYELFGTNLNVGQILHYNNEEAEITELPEETGDPYRIRIKPNGEWAKATTKTITAYLSKNTKNSIIENYQKTQNDYEKGKETATIRCSISDYFDYETGEKIISIDNSTGKMSFKLYDQVIPMVYGADGKDRPMSTYQDGKPKAFQVLGSNIYYDGAVWQELPLQEV